MLGNTVFGDGDSELLYSRDYVSVLLRFPAIRAPERQLRFQSVWEPGLSSWPQTSWLPIS
jgi:hypothetical protein